jgi:hypothetical protein
MLAAVVPALTGVPIGTTLSGTGVGGIAIEHVIIAPWLTSGGIGPTVTPARPRIKPQERRCTTLEQLPAQR